VSTDPATDRDAARQALATLPPGEGADTMTVLRLSGLNSSQAKDALGRLVGDGVIEDWWTEGNPRVRMYRLREGQ
jgi:hypothetical protein